MLTVPGARCYSILYFASSHAKPFLWPLIADSVSDWTLHSHVKTLISFILLRCSWHRRGIRGFQSTLLKIDIAMEKLSACLIVRQPISWACIACSSTWAAVHQSAWLSISRGDIAAQPVACPACFANCLAATATFSLSNRIKGMPWSLTSTCI